MEKKSLFSSFKFKMFLMIVLTIITSSTLTYGFFVTSKNQSGKSSMTTTCFNVTFEEGASISLENAFSMTDASGQATEPYTFSITNTCDNETAYTVLLSSTINSFSNEFISVSLNNDVAKVLNNLPKNQAYSVGENYKESFILQRGSLKKDEKVTYDLRAWINAKATYDNVKGQTWEGEVKIVSGIKEVEDLKFLSKKFETLVQDKSINFENIATTNEGIFKLDDNDGTSYYYRGAVDNNYVNLAGLNFRIVRLNGDGSLRIVYDGNDTPTVFPSVEDNNSNINVILNEWYQENIVKKGYDKYISTTSFCSDTKDTISSPVFTCSNAINKKVGLLSLDELIAGGHILNTPNMTSYLYSDSVYWLGTFKDENNMYVLNNGSIMYQDIKSEAKLKPVINVAKEFVDSMGGNGTKDNPYRM